ncbi:MAG: HEAT repeat domain-containing protein, partial [Acidobacteria bacterium]|nr:HEAT repeat domain-containing protein [Acidobacteriota bacterium]
MTGSTINLHAGKWSGLVGGILLCLLAATALANTALGNVQAEQNLKDPEPKVRERAAQELGEGGNPAYVTVLAAAVQDQDEKVRMAVVKSLIRLGTEASLEPLSLALRDSIPEIRAWAINGLVNFYLPGYVDTGVRGFFRSMKTRVGSFFSDVDTVVIDPDVQPSAEVVRTLGQTVTGAPYMQTRVQAARALGILRAREAVPDLVKAAFDDDVDLILEVLRAFQKIKETSVGPRISFLMNYPQKSVQRATAITLGLLRTESAIPELRNLLETTGDKNVRVAALDALAFMPQPETGPVFLRYMENKEKLLRAAAALGLGRLKDLRYPGAL